MFNNCKTIQLALFLPIMTCVLYHLYLIEINVNHHEYMPFKGIFTTDEIYFRELRHKKQRSQIIDLNQIYIYHQLVMVLLKNN